MPVLLRLLAASKLSLLSKYQTGTLCSRAGPRHATFTTVPTQHRFCIFVHGRFQRNAWHPALPLPMCAACTCSNSWSTLQLNSKQAIASKRPTVVQASSQPVNGTPEQNTGPSILTLPTMLTLARVAAIPALITAWFWQDPAATVLVTGLFAGAAVTDWLDGYLARKLNASSPFGAFLDPVADKLMVATVLVLLSTQPLAAGPLAGNAWLMPVVTLTIVGREITMSALREWAATLGPAARSAVAVNAWGKWKTATQMVALTCLLFTRDGASTQLAAAAATAAVPLLAIASYLTAHSLVVYMMGLWKFMK